VARLVLFERELFGIARLVWRDEQVHEPARPQIHRDVVEDAQLGPPHDDALAGEVLGEDVDHTPRFAGNCINATARDE